MLPTHKAFQYPPPVSPYRKDRFLTWVLGATLSYKLNYSKWKIKVQVMSSKVACEYQTKYCVNAIEPKISKMPNICCADNRSL